TAGEGSRSATERRAAWGPGATETGEWPPAAPGGGHARRYGTGHARTHPLDAVEMTSARYNVAGISCVTTLVTPHPANQAECRPSPPATTTTTSSAQLTTGTRVSGSCSSIQAGQLRLP